MLPAYRRRQLLIAGSLLAILLLPFAGSKLWHAITALTAPPVSSLYGAWRVEPHDLGGVQIRLPVAQYLQLQEGKVALDQSPFVPAQLHRDGNQLQLTLDNPQLGSIGLTLTVEDEARLSYSLPVIGSKVYFRRVGS